MSDTSFLTPSNKVRNCCLYVGFVCLSISRRTLYFAFKFFECLKSIYVVQLSIQCFVLKLVYISITIRVQRLTKEFRHNMCSMNENFQKCILTYLYCTKSYEINTNFRQFPYGERLIHSKSRQKRNLHIEFEKNR